MLNNHSDDPSHGYQNVGVTKPDVRDTPEDIQVSPVNPYVMPAIHPCGSYHPQNI